MRPRVWIALATCALSLSGAAQTTRKAGPAAKKAAPAPAVSQVDKAEDALGRGDFAAAETLLKGAVESNPKDYRAWYDLGFAENALGKLLESVDAYRKSLALKPDVFE